MDGLLAEISAKRKLIEEDARPSKYMRRGDLEKLKEEQKRKADQEKAEQQQQLEAASRAKAPKPSESPSESPPPDDPVDEPAKAESSFNISNEETVRRLRSKGQPIRLFAESDKDRRLRLRALELIDQKGQEKVGGQNDFKKALEDVENVERELKNKNSSNKGKKKEESEDAQQVLDLTVVKSDPNSLYPLIYYALKRVLKEWEEAMDERPEHIKRTTQGKLAAATQVQSAEYLKPLFKTLKKRALPDDVLARMAEIVHYMQKRQYQKANDSYLRLSIGNAPWPIGVTMVGIHERSAREKISSDQVAHVLNDEVSRKYIQSLKRLLTFSQTKYPPEDVSQLMG
ncbi:Prp18 domain-containing protein [Mycena floridula]|nr:Prp18 domain-containing protein [Mycena floridula]